MGRGVIAFLENTLKITDRSQFFCFTFVNIGIPEREKLSISSYSTRHHRNSLNGLILILAPQSLSLSPMSSKQIMHACTPASWHMLESSFLPNKSSITKMRASSAFWPFLRLSQEFLIVFTPQLLT